MQRKKLVFYSLVMFVHGSLQIYLVLNKLIMAMAEKLTHENAEASASQGVIVSGIFEALKCHLKLCNQKD